MDEMRELLNSISIEMIRVKDFEYKQDQINSKWFGNEPTTLDIIEQAENRLQVNFPQDYKEFLMVANGFHAFSTVEPTFLPINKIDYLNNIDSESIEGWKQAGFMDIAKSLERSILVAGVKEEQSFLLIPPNSKSGDWKYWKYANWIPGEEEYTDLREYLRDTLDFLKTVKENQGG